jgi:hypothetical protein
MHELDRDKACARAVLLSAWHVLARAASQGHTGETERRAGVAPAGQWGGDKADGKKTGGVEVCAARSARETGAC